MNDLINMKSRINDFEKELKRLEGVLDKMKEGFNELKEKEKNETKEPLRIGDYGFIYWDGERCPAYVKYPPGDNLPCFVLEDAAIIADKSEFTKVGNIFDDLKSK